MLSMLPEELREEYTALFEPQPEDKELWVLCKAADKLTAYIKCLEEEKMGNREFVHAGHATLASLEKMDLPELKVFMEEYLPAFTLTLDELNQGE